MSEPHWQELAQQELSPRQLQILKMHMAGLSHRKIALGLGISTGTVSNHMHRIKQKLGIALTKAA